MQKSESRMEVGIARRLSAKCVPRGITDRISLRLDDATAEPAIIATMDRYFANQVARHLHSIHRELRSTETPKTTKGNRLVYAFHLSLRYCEAPAARESGWSSPSIVGMSSETVG
jgi:hypothetical protein